MIRRFKKLNRFLSSLMAVLMIMSTITYNANASETSLIEPNTVIEKIDPIDSTTESAIKLLDVITPPTKLEKVFVVANVSTGTGISLTISTANMFQTGNSNDDTEAVFEISGLDFENNSYWAEIEINGEKFDSYVGEYGSIGLVNVIGSFEGPTEVKVTISNSSYKPTVIYETVSLYIYFTSLFEINNLEDINNESEIVNYRDLNPSVRFDAPLSYETENIFLKLVDANDEVYAVSNDFRDINTYENSIGDSRYNSIFTVNHGIHSDIKSIYTSLYCGKPLEPGNYNIEVYDYEGNLLYTVDNILEVTNLPVVRISGYVYDFPLIYTGVEEIYGEIYLEGGDLEDFDIQLYDSEDNLIAESNGIYYPMNVYDYTANVVYKLDLLAGMSLSEGRYTYKLKSDVLCEYEGDQTIYVNDSGRNIYKAVSTNFKYANVVLFGQGFDTNHQYKAVLLNSETDDLIAEKLVMPINNVFDIEFKDINGNVIELENETSYMVYVKEKEYDGEWEDCGAGRGFFNYYNEDEINMLEVTKDYGGSYFDSMTLCGHIWLSEATAANYSEPNNFKIVAINVLGQEYTYDNLIVETFPISEGGRYYYLEESDLSDMPFGSYKLKLYYGNEEVLVNGLNVFYNDYYDRYTDAPSAGYYSNHYNNVRFISGYSFENISEINNPQLKLYDAYKSSVSPEYTINLYNESENRAMITNDNFSNVDMYKKYNGIIYVNGKVVGTSEGEYFAPDDLVVDENIYTVSIEQPENGLLTSSIESSAKGKLVYIFNEPVEGYQLKLNSIKVNGKPIMGRCFMLSGDAVVTAEFEPVHVIRYSIDVYDYICNGDLTVDKTQAAEGEIVTITVNPDENYKLNRLQYRAVNTSQYIDIDPTSKTFEMPGYDIEIEAYFDYSDSYRVNSLNVVNGYVFANGGLDIYITKGNTVYLQIIPHDSYQLKNGSLYYMIDGDYSTTYPIVDNKFFMPNSNITIYAQFESAPYNITIDSLGNGTIVSDKLTAYSNEMVTLTITPNQGYKLKDNIIKINGVNNYSYSNTYSFYMYNNDVVITAEFVEHDMLPEDKYNVNKKSWNIRPSFSPMMSNEIYSLDQGTLYATTVIKDLNGNVVLENIGTDIDIVGGYNLYKTSPIDAGKYIVEIIYGDYAKSLSIGVTNIEFGDFIDANYNIPNYYDNFTTDTKSFSVDVWIYGLFSDLENLNLKLIESETGNVVAGAVDKDYVYYNEKDNDSADSTGKYLEFTDMKFDFILDSALETEKTYSIYADYNKEIIFGYAAEISVTSNPFILEGNISGNTITFKTECLSTGTYVANYNNIIDYNLVVDENGIGTIDLSSNSISENYAYFNVYVGETVVNARAYNDEIEEKYVETIDIHNSVNYYYNDAATNQNVHKLLPLTDSLLFTLNNVSEGIVSLEAYQDGNFIVVDEMEVSELVGGEGSFEYNFDTKVVYRINVSGAGSITFKVTDRPMLSINKYQVEGYYGNSLVIPYEGSVNIDDLSKIKFIYGAATGDIEFPIISYSSSEIKLDMSNAPVGIFKIRAIYPDYADGYDYDVDFSRSLSVYRVGDDSPNITALREDGYKYYAEGVNFDKVTNALVKIYKPVNGYLNFVKQADIVKTSDTRLDVPESATSDLQDGTYVLYYLLDGIDKAAQIIEYTPNLSLYNVTFNSNGGSNVVGLTDVLEGTTIKMPSAPTKSGYKFIGWFKDAELTEQWNFEADTIESDITLYAKWEVAYTVKFHSMGGSQVSDYKGLQPNSLIDESKEPEREGYEFSGWYKDFELTNPWNFQQDTVTQNVTLYAKWEAISYIIAVSPTTGDRVNVQTSAKAGDIVQVTVAKDENNELQSIYWTGIPISQKNSINTETLSFVMPAQNIEIGAFFNEMYNLTVNVSKADSPYWIYVYGQNKGYSDNIELPAGTTQHTLRVPSGNYDIYIYMGENENWYYSHQTKLINDNTGVEFIIPTTYAISGKVVCTNGVLDNAYVYAYSNSDYRYGYINSDGTYSIAGLLPGEYTVAIDDWNNKYIGELNKTVVIVAANAADINFSVAKGADLRVSLSKTEGTPAFKSYVYLYKFNGYDWEYVSNAIGSGTGELGFSGAINSVGSYKIALEYLENKNYTSPRFVSEPVEFTVTEEDIAAGTIAKTLTYSDPIDASAALSGDGNIVVTNVKTARTGDFISLEVRYKNNGNVVITPKFYINLPAGVTMTDSNVFSTSLNPNADGVYKCVLYVGNVNSDVVSIDVDVELNAETFDFGNADISITKVTLNAPMNVKANESFKAYGEATEGSKVMIKDAVTGQILKTVTTQGKFYTADIILPEGTTKLVAEVLLTDNTTVQSKPVEVVAKSEPIAVENVYKNNYGVGLNSRLGVHAFSEYVDMNLMGFAFTLRTEFTNSSNISSVVYHFSGLDFTANSNYEALISGWGGAGIKPITATVTTTGGEELTFTIAEVTILIDPSGIIKNSITGEPLAGAEVTCWIRNDYGIWEKWDAENYGQSNPQITGADGKYGWMVPEGVYRITATKAGFKDYDTMFDSSFSIGNESTIIIPPPRDDVNFSMIPEVYNISVGIVTGGNISVQQTAANTDYVTVTVTPDSGMKLKNILVDGVAIEGFRFEMPSKDVVVTAEFVQDAFEVTGEIEYFVMELGEQLVMVKIGDVDGYAIAYSTQNKLYQYLKGSNNVPVVYGMKSGNKYMLVGSSKGYALNYSLYPSTIEAMHNTDVIPNNFVKTIKVLEGFDDLGNAILKPLQ